MLVEQPSANVCPHCKAPVDPLRSPAVSIVGARLVHFCSTACRESHLRSPLPVDPVPATTVTAPEIEPQTDWPASPTDQEPPPSLADTTPATTDRPPIRGMRVVLPLLGSLLAAFATLAAARWWNEIASLGIAGLLAAWHLVRGLLRARQQGVSRVLDALAAPLAALTLIVAGATSRDSIAFAASAALLLAVLDLGHLLEVSARRRSGVLGLLRQSTNTQLGESFRDNARASTLNQRIAMVLSWGRLPVAAAGGVLAGLLGGDLPSSLVLGAALLVSLNPRALRMATVDAYFAAALRLNRLGARPRDGEALEQLGRSRVILFEGPGTAFSEEAIVASTRLLPGVDEQAALEALLDIESQADSRLSKAIASHLRAKGLSHADCEGFEDAPDLGVCGTTRHGHAACGSRAYLLSLGIATGAVEELAVPIEESGRRAIMLALHSRVVGILALEDKPSADAMTVAKQLAGAGRFTLLVTTAEATAAQALARRMGMGDACFATPNSELHRVSSAFEAAGETPTVVGASSLLEDIAHEIVTIRVGGEGPTQAATDARAMGMTAVPTIFDISAKAAASARVNTACAVVCCLLCLGLAATWAVAPIVAGISGLQAMTAAAATLNRPFPAWARAKLSASRLSVRVSRELRKRFR